MRPDRNYNKFAWLLFALSPEGQAMAERYRRNELGNVRPEPTFDATMRDLAQEEANRLKAVNPSLNAKQRKRMARQAVLEAAR